VPPLKFTWYERFEMTLVHASSESSQHPTSLWTTPSSRRSLTGLIAVGPLSEPTINDT
jgi:hypothetical protein